MNPQPQHIHAVRKVMEDRRGYVWDTELPFGILKECKAAGWLKTSYFGIGMIYVTDAGRKVAEAAE